MKKKKRINNEVDLHQLKASMKMGKSSAISALNFIKKKTESEKLFGRFKELVPQSVICDVNNSLFPRDINFLCNPTGFIQSSSIANEIIWTISIILLFKSDMQRFVEISNDVERLAIRNESVLFSKKIREIESEFGLSIWSIQNRISAMQHWYGNDEKKELVKELRDSIKDNALLDLIIYFTGKRVEGSSVPGYLQSELAKTFKNPNLKIVHDYVRAKVLDANDLALEQVTSLLCFDFNSSIVDLYESLISVLRWAISDEISFRELKSLLKKPVEVLYRSVKDKRLLPVLISLDSAFEFDYENEREMIIENYTAGNYSKSRDLSRIYLAKDENVDDISILLISLKSESKLDENYEFSGQLSKIAFEFRRVLSFSDESYQAALSLNSLNDKFMTHSWSNFIKVAVMNELSVQDYSSSLDYLRDLYAREVRMTPLSFLLSNNKDYVLNNIKKFKERDYEKTKGVLEIASIGNVLNENIKNEISKGRYLKYLGRYYLSIKEYQLAINTFADALSYVNNSDSLKCNAAIITAYVRSGNIHSAVVKLVDTFLDWEEVPTALPFEELIEVLDDPDVWPDTIHLALTFALYTQFFRNNRIAHLRLSFERFNILNSIGNPIDFIRDVPNVNLKYKSLYLKLVWRPEIMGQTLLYTGTKDIEEARIQVCKSLIEIDPGNALEYQAEIRERVKHIELAKAAKLVDQTRVYVDVNAIKSTLKSKLGNVYSKYKNTMSSINDDSSELVEALESAFDGINDVNTSITKMMSSIHIIGSEDNQFAAIFSEVTNEFLLGEHGLNAYLSTRVRHGKFSNAIRKPIVDEHLVTEMSEKTGKYAVNVFWGEMLTELDSEEKDNVLLHLETFGRKIDDIICHVRDNLIQVSIRDDLLRHSENPHALFTYRTSNVERMYAQSKLKALENIDEFIEYCIDSLWEKTDDNLLKVKLVILRDVKHNILNSFDKLNESLGQMECNYRLGELHNHIARAKTNIQHQIGNVATWFTRSEVYDRPDYTLDFPVLIAKKMVVNLISGLDSWNGMKIFHDGTHSLMPGRTLDGMVDVYCAAIENAIEHSNLNINEIQLEVNLSYLSGQFSVQIKNNIANDVISSESEMKLENIRDEIRKKDTRIKAQKEKGSGFHKIWSTINSPHYKEPKLHFSYEDSNFIVNINFRIEASDD